MARWVILIYREVIFIKKCAVWNLTKEEIQEKVNSCYCICDMLEVFGYKRTSGSMAKVMKNIINAYDIDISHFKPYQRTNQKPQYSLNEILIPNSPYTNITKLKERIIKANILKYECEFCGNKGIWNGQLLTLQLDHKNGNHADHSIDNLRFLCPNCHSQTETFAGRNAKYGRR